MEGFLSVLKDSVWLLAGMGGFWYVRGQLDALRHSMLLFERDLKTVSHVLVGMGNRIVSLQTEQRKIAKRCEALEQQQKKQGMEQSYHHAKKLCELGVNLHEIATHCHIPFSEVALIAKLSEQSRTANKSEHSTA